MLPCFAARVSAPLTSHPIVAALFRARGMRRGFTTDRIKQGLIESTRLKRTNLQDGSRLGKGAASDGALLKHAVSEGHRLQRGLTGWKSRISRGLSSKTPHDKGESSVASVASTMSTVLHDVGHEMRNADTATPSRPHSVAEDETMQEVASGSPEEPTALSNRDSSTATLERAPPPPQASPPSTAETRTSARVGSRAPPMTVTQVPLRIPLPMNTEQARALRPAENMLACRIEALTKEFAAQEAINMEAYVRKMKADSDDYAFLREGSDEPGAVYFRYLRLGELPASLMSALGGISQRVGDISHRLFARSSEAAVEALSDRDSRPDSEARGSRVSSLGGWQEEDMPLDDWLAC